MCGIVGFISRTPECHYEIISNCIKELQNRGYDSIGISIINNDKFLIEKKIGGNFFGSDSLQSLSFKNCIGHTRWATHGCVSENNAHPHLDSQFGLFTIVHNGIIENYLEIKDILEQNNIILNSETDSEILLNYIVLKYKNCIFAQDDETRIKISILDALKNIEGTYGIVLQSLKHPDKLFSIRKGSPLLIGVDHNHTKLLILSEKQAFPSFIEKIIRLNTNELVVCKFNNTVLIKEFITGEKINNDVQEPTKLEHFRFFTEKEIYDQLNLVKNVTKMYSRFNNDCIKLGGLDSMKHKLNNIKYLYIFGCGTSYHSALIIQYLFLKYLKFINVQVFDGSDFDPLFLPNKYNSLEVSGLFLSQSGETLDLLIAHSIFKKQYNESITLGITNVVDSHLSTITDAGVYTNMGKERGVASTKSFTSQVLTGILILLWFYELQFQKPKMKNMIDELKNLEDILQRYISFFDRDVKTIILPFIKSHSKMFIMGRKIDFYIAKEGALKIKEISYLNAEAYSSGSLKHGPFALLDPSYLVIFILTENCPENIKKVLNNIQEILSRGTKILLITNEKIILQSPLLLIYNIPLNLYSFLLASIVLQFIAYHLSIHQNINPDFPRNLAKVVTVE